jgi:hypothetical protein
VKCTSRAKGDHFESENSRFANQRTSIGIELLTGPRELVHERESFIGGYCWQRRGLGVDSPGLNVGGGRT